jgi:hypothetical protein
MKCHGHIGWVLIALLGLSGCASLVREQPRAEPLDPITVRESGFGTFADMAERNQSRERLKARRASRLDAYRNLAERVYGTVVYGGSTVNEFVLESDRFRSYVDSYIRGAKVVAVNEHEDGVVETIMELKLEPRFRACVANVNPVTTPELCPIPMPGLNDRAGDLEARARADVDSLYFLE